MATIYKPFGTLQKLPPEIRARIFAHTLDLNSSDADYVRHVPAIPGTIPTSRSSMNRIALLRVNAHISKEAKPLLYKTNKFYVQVTSDGVQVPDGSASYDWRMGIAREGRSIYENHFFYMGASSQTGPESITFHRDWLKEIQNFVLIIHQEDCDEALEPILSKSVTNNQNLLDIFMSVRRFLGNCNNILSLDLKIYLRDTHQKIPAIMDPLLEELLNLCNVQKGSIMMRATECMFSTNGNVYVKQFALSDDFADFIVDKLKRKTQDLKAFKGVKYVKIYDEYEVEVAAKAEAKARIAEAKARSAEAKARSAEAVAKFLAQLPN